MSASSVKGSVGRRSHPVVFARNFNSCFQLRHEQRWIVATWSGRWELNPRQPAWKAGTLPLSYARLDLQRDVERGSHRTVMTGLDTHHCLPHCLLWWAGKDSNLGSRWQQIYSLPPLATWVPARNLQRKKFQLRRQASPRPAPPLLKIKDGSDEQRT